MHCVSIFKLAKDPVSAVNVLNHMESRKLDVDTFLYNNVISVCTKVGDERLALDLLLSMKSKGVSSDVISFSSVINAFAKRGKWKESLNLLKEMSNEGIHADTICYSSAISACATAGCWREALVLISTMKSNTVPLDTIVCNSAIVACGPSGEWTVALRLMELMKAEGLTPNSYSYAAAMTACDMGGQCDEVVSLLQRMVASMSTRATLIASSSTDSESHILHQKPTHHKTLSVHEVTVPFNVAITALMKCGRISKAKEVFDQMGMIGVPKNTVTYTAFITGVTKSKHFDQRIILDVHDEMIEANLRRNEAIFGAVIAAAEKEGEWELALKLLEVMKTERIETTSFIYHSAISACGKADRYDEAVELLKEMKQRRVERTCVTYSLMISACKTGGRWEEALRFLSDMEKDDNAGVKLNDDSDEKVVSRPGEFLRANTLVYGAVISVCVESQQWGLALELLERMEVLGVQRNVVTYNTVIEALSNAGESARAELVYQSAVRTGNQTLHRYVNALTHHSDYQ
jgi:pentatricopeptide repeat protein